MRHLLRGGLLVWAWAVGGLSLSCGQALGPQAVATALQRAYPGWVEVVPGDPGPVFQVDGQRFAWAEARLLPWDQQAQWASYSPQPFYPYPAEEPDVSSWSDEALAQAEAHLLDRRTDAPKRSSAFFNALWSIHDRGSADAAQRRIRFFGLPVTVHRSLVAALGRIETRLNSLRTSDPGLEAFLGNIKGFDGYNWRDIAETQSRSNHAYGAAIDLIARSYGGKNPYWLWAPQDKPGWYKSAWAHRWGVPRVFVKAFEDEGFVWGGKWLLFDTIHFEYRPEILILNGLR